MKNITSFLQQLPKRHRKPFELAYAVAIAGPGVGGRSKHSFKHGAVLIDGKSLKGARFNVRKSHPKLLNIYNYPYLHAEGACILSVGMDNCSGTSVYVLRVFSDGTIANSKPCEQCIRLMTLAKVRKVYYSTGDETSFHMDVLK